MFKTNRVDHYTAATNLSELKRIEIKNNPHKYKKTKVIPTSISTPVLYSNERLDTMQPSLASSPSLSQLSEPTTHSKAPGFFSSWFQRMSNSPSPTTVTPTCSETSSANEDTPSREASPFHPFNPLFRAIPNSQKRAVSVSPINLNVNDKINCYKN